jgi:hypothetical protein
MFFLASYSVTYLCYVTTCVGYFLLLYRQYLVKFGMCLRTAVTHVFKEKLNDAGMQIERSSDVTEIKVKLSLQAVKAHGGSRLRAPHI